MAFVGFEVDKKEDLQNYASKLESKNIEVNLGNSSYSDKRFVEELIHFNDPQGNRVEMVYNPMKDTEPFKPSRPISGFKTGALGMGHVVLHVKDFNKVVPFYRDILGFKISDIAIHQSHYVFFILMVVTTV